MPCQILPFPEELRPRLPTILGNVDYHTLRRRLQQIDALLRQSGVEREFIQRALDRWDPAGPRVASASEQTRYQRRSRRALRCNLLRTLLQEDFRGFSIQLAGNPLYQWFCGIDALDVVRVFPPRANCNATPTGCRPRSCAASSMDCCAAPTKHPLDSNWR